MSAAISLFRWICTERTRIHRVPLTPELPPKNFPRLTFTDRLLAPGLGSVVIFQSASVSKLADLQVVSIIREIMLLGSCASTSHQPYGYSLTDRCVGPLQPPEQTRWDPRRVSQRLRRQMFLHYQNLSAIDAWNVGTAKYTRKLCSRMKQIIRIEQWQMPWWP